MIYDVIIIGGGIAGLNIAYQLTKTSTTFLLLEQSKHLGGRIATFHSKTMTVEMGAGRFSPKHHPLLKQLLQEFGLFDKRVKNNKHSEYIPLNPEKSDTKKEINQYLSTVFEKSKQVPNEILRQMTFEEYAKTVILETQVEEIKKSFGYYSELVIMNAYDSIRLMKVLDTSFYSLDGGFSQLIERMRDHILQFKNPFRYQQEVLDIIPTRYADSDYYQIPTKKGKIYHARKCILAIPKESLEKIPVLRSIQSMLSQVKTSPLCRIYSRFEDPWFSDLSKIMTDDALRMVIPINENILMSYTDNKYANYWKRIDTKKIDETLVKHLQKVIKKTHPEIEVPFPEETHVFYWEHGVGYWTKHANSEETSKKMLQPFLSDPLRKHIYICGESYSENQQWIEGSLETSMKVLKLAF